MNDIFEQAVPNLNKTMKSTYHYAHGNRVYVSNTEAKYCFYHIFLFLFGFQSGVRADWGKIKHRVIDAVPEERFFECEVSTPL